MSHVHRLFATAVAVAGFLAGCCALPEVAGADPSAPTPCTVPSLSQPFLPWGDAGTYELVPGGDFEGSLDGWSLQGGAVQAPGSERFGVTGSVGASSLMLPPGAVAIAPAACVNVPHPDARLFVHSADAGAELTVRTLNGTDAERIAVRAGRRVSPIGDWAPTNPLRLHPVASATRNGGTAAIALEFQATGGTVYIDDVFVDPRGRF